MANETIENYERMCGFLKHDHGYLKSPPASERGLLPAFVRVEPEEKRLAPEWQGIRAPMVFNGIQFERVNQDNLEFNPLEYPEEKAKENHIDQGIYSIGGEFPETEVERHFDRLEYHAENTEHLGEQMSWKSPDLLMGVGESHYKQPEDFIEEVLKYGLSKGVSIDKHNPINVMSGVTRLWLWHPNATENDRPGIIGYVYLSRLVYTEPEDGKVPNYIKEHEENGYLDIVEVGEPKSEYEVEAEKLTEFEE
jgi:hypothetical protein